MSKIIISGEEEIFVMTLSRLFLKRIISHLVLPENVQASSSTICKNSKPDAL
jgi:hypothetical protein